MINQKIAHFGGRIPSVICIAYAARGNNKRVKTIIMLNKIFFILSV
jgi:hypothetical protein